MNIRKFITCITLFGSVTICAQQPVDYVNPFIGTSNYGTTNPGAICPQGMMSVTPFNVMVSVKNRFDKDSQWLSTPYSSDISFFTGFAHVNLSGVCRPYFGRILLFLSTVDFAVYYRVFVCHCPVDVAAPVYF